MFKQYAILPTRTNVLHFVLRVGSEGCTRSRENKAHLYATRFPWGKFCGMNVIIELENIGLVMSPFTFSSQYVCLFSVDSQLLPQSTQDRKHSIFSSFISIQI